MRFFKEFPIIVILISIAVFSYSQEETFKCLTPEMNKLAEEKDPSIKERRAALAEFTKEYIARKDKSEEIYIIPVVFHVVHDNGPENISKAQIEDAIRVINDDYRKMSADTSDIIPEFKSIAADSRIEFRLANLDPNGNCTEGITRTQSHLTYTAGEEVKAVALSWPRAMYLNIWVVNSISGSAAAYAYYPGTAGDGWDGILCSHTYVGSIGTSSQGRARTLSHEIGHYLNLAHPWGSTNDPGLPDNCNIDDGISDTPNTIGHTSCSLYSETCGSLDNVQNYMDYSYCGRMFTLGQKDVMRAALNSSESDRNNLWIESNLIATGTNDGYVEVDCEPIASFQNTPTSGCQGYIVEFDDNSYNTDSIYTYSWLFPGGSPASSADKSPVVTYDTPGTYDVSLTVTNSVGNDVIQEADLVKVIDPNQGEMVPYSEGFEYSGFPQHSSDPVKDWTIESNGTDTWQWSDHTSHTGSGCLRIPNFTIPPGAENHLISPNIVMDTTDNMSSLSFAVAYAKRNSNSEDRLNMYVSTDCGASWHIRYSKVAYVLSTNGGAEVASGWTPDPSEWRTDVVNLGPYASADNLIIKFTMISERGSWLYLDDINFSETSDIEEIDYTTLHNFIVYPNPFKNNVSLTYDIIESKSDVIVEINDLVGKQVYYSKQNQMIGQQTLTLSNELNFEKGVYFVNLIIDGKRMTEKIMCVE
jgi:PKD repeat protein